MAKAKRPVQKKSKTPHLSYPELLNLANSGNLFLMQGKLNEAIASYQKVLLCKPDFAEVHNNLGVALQQQGKFSLAVEHHQRALALKPEYAQAHLNLGMAFNDLGDFTGAIAEYKQTLALEPHYADAHYNLALALKNQGSFNAAIASYLQALKLNPNFAEAKMNLGFLLLSLGQFTEGWQGYESRYNPSIKNRMTIPPRLHFPQWQGESLKGKSLVIWREQGLGDEIQFCRYVAHLKKLGAKQITWVCKKPLQSLLTTLKEVDNVLTEEEASTIATHDYWTLALSVPLHCQATLNSIPATVPYLYADETQVQSVALELCNINEFKVGVCWKGNPNFKNDLLRSPGIIPFQPLFKLVGVKFFTLQPETRLEFLRVVGRSAVDRGREIDETTFDDASALITNLDLIISSDTSICHLAGALGKPVWVILPFEADWRWLREREDSPWYPTMRLFRQTKVGDWNEVFARVEMALKQLINQSH